MVRRQLLVLLLAGAVAGCGGDPEPGERAAAPSRSTTARDAQGTATTPEPTSTATPALEPSTRSEAAPETEPAPEAEPRLDTTTAPEEDGGAGAPEDLRREREEQQGGAGDEQAIRTDVRLTGRGGRIRPPRVSVPGFIQVRLLLRSADGASYGLVVDGRRLRAGRSLTLPGRPSGERYVGRGTPSGRVVIDFSAEPGG